MQYEHHYSLANTSHLFCRLFTLCTPWHLSTQTHYKRCFSSSLHLHTSPVASHVCCNEHLHRVNNTTHLICHYHTFFLFIHLHHCTSTVYSSSYHDCTHMSLEKFYSTYTVNCCFLTVSCRGSECLQLVWAYSVVLGTLK